MNTARLLFIAIPALYKMNGADSEPGRQLPTTAARENGCNATQVTSVLCRRWRPSRNRICWRSNLCYVHFAFVFTLNKINPSQIKCTIIVSYLLTLLQ